MRKLYDKDGNVLGTVSDSMDTDPQVTEAQMTNQVSEVVVVDGDIWVFQASDNSVGIGSVKIFAFDENTHEVTQKKKVDHRFGHCNSVDYCVETDCLILAYQDGKQDPILQDIIYIIPNAKSVIPAMTNAPTLADVGAIEYDCRELTGGTAHGLNCAWGPRNLGRYDMAVFIQDMETYRFIQFGKGANQFELGVYNSEAGEDEFNGTFRVAQTFTCDPHPGYVNQGATWYGNKLYMGVGHYYDLYWVVSFHYDGTLGIEEVYNPYYGADGSEPGTHSTEGIAVTDKYIVMATASTLVSQLEIRRW
jgi:hypothetical protein